MINVDIIADIEQLISKSEFDDIREFYSNYSAYHPWEH